MSERITSGRSRIWWGVRLLLILVITALAWRGVEYAHAFCVTRPAYMVDPSLCRAGPWPDWMTLDEIATIRRDAGLSGTTSFFMPGLREKYSRAYARSPWVEEVVAVRPRYPNRVCVELRLALPAATIRVGEEWHLVREDGVRLPSARKERPTGFPDSLPALTGVTERPPAAGEVWSRAVREGVAVAEDLKELTAGELEELSVAEIDVRNVGGLIDPTAPEIVLRTESGVVIEWHRSSVSEGPFVVAPLDGKLRNLRRALGEYPELRGLKTVRVQFDALYVEMAGEPRN